MFPLFLIFQIVATNAIPFPYGGPLCSLADTCEKCLNDCECAWCSNSKNVSECPTYIVKDTFCEKSGNVDDTKCKGVWIDTSIETCQKDTEEEIIILCIVFAIAYIFLCCICITSICRR